MCKDPYPADLTEWKKDAAKRASSISTADEFGKQLYLSGNPRAGFVHRRGRVSRPAKDWSDPTLRKLQILKHISAQLFFGVQSAFESDKLKTKPIEIEAMWAAGSVYVAANNTDVARYVHRMIVTDGGLEQTLFGKYSHLTGYAKNQNSKYAAKMEAWYRGTRGGGKTGDASRNYRDAQEIADVVKEAIDAKTPANHIQLMSLASGKITPAPFKSPGKIFVVAGHPERILTLSDEEIQKLDPDVKKIGDVKRCHEDGRHAEMKLLYLVVKAGFDEAVYIAGKKRPCMGCYTTMKWVNEQRQGKAKHHINFSARPGKIFYNTWSEEEKSIKEAFVAQLPSTDVHETQRRIVGPRGGVTERHHPDFASDSESDEERKENGETSQAKKRKRTTKTADDSDDSDTSSDDDQPSAKRRRTTAPATAREERDRDTYDFQSDSDDDSDSESDDDQPPAKRRRTTTPTTARKKSDRDTYDFQSDSDDDSDSESDDDQPPAKRRRTTTSRRNTAAANERQKRGRDTDDSTSANKKRKRSSSRKGR